MYCDETMLAGVPMKETCESKEDLKFFMCEVINEHIENDCLLRGDRKAFSKRTGGSVSEALLSRIKNYDVDSIKLDSIMVVFFNLNIDLVFSFEPVLNINKKSPHDTINKKMDVGDLSI